MKNNYKLFLLILFCYLFISQNKIFANEIVFDTLEINITNGGKVIDAGAGSIISSNDSLEIKAQNFKYDKSSSILTAIGGTAILQDRDIKIKANKFIYNKMLSTLRAIGNVEVKNLKNKSIIKSENIFYQKEEEILISNVKSTLIDKLGNNFFTDNFIYTLSDDLIKISNAKVVSSENDILHIEKAYLDLSTNQLIGGNASIDFDNKNFNKDNEPRLKGRTIKIEKEKTILKKGIFTTCKKNNDCPPWQFLAEKITHDKIKKTINYDKAWLKIYDKPVLYFPKFFHPDPTVKRQSGFLTPSFSSSNSVGSGFTVPYFHAISDNRDLTISPRFYSHEKILAQSEYRAVYKELSHKVDFSLLSDQNTSSKSHFFSNSKRNIKFENFDEGSMSLQLQKTSSDTYLKKYSIQSPLMVNNNLLTSKFGIQAYRPDLRLNTEFTVYEDLSKTKDNDKFEFIYPSYDLTKDLSINSNSAGNLSLSSNGYMKNYNTNIFEKVVINDLLFSSFPKFTRNGLKNNYNVIIKNVNTNGENSEKYKESSSTKFSSLMEFNTSYPLKKKTTDYTNILKPTISVRYSPNNTRNLKDNDRRIDVNSVFGLNRIGSNDDLEGGGSLSLGTEFTKTDLFNRDVFNAKIANVLRLKENKNLPSNSSLGKKTSDLMGSINYDPNKFFKIDYTFSQDENLKDSNYQLLKNEFKVNNFVTTFEYLNQNNTIKNQGYLSTKTSYDFSKSKSIILEARENKETKATEFYNLIYQYRNDCLIAAIQYNKDYYSDKDIQPTENIFLKLTIVPFGETKSPSINK